MYGVNDVSADSKAVCGEPRMPVPKLISKLWVGRVSGYMVPCMLVTFFIAVTKYLMKQLMGGSIY